MQNFGNDRLDNLLKVQPAWTRSGTNSGIEPSLTYPCAHPSTRPERIQRRSTRPRETRVLTRMSEQGAIIKGPNRDPGSKYRYGRPGILTRT